MNRRHLLQAGLAAAGLHTVPTRAGSAGDEGAPTQRYWVSWTHGGEELLLALTRQSGRGDIVLFVHGATFPAALSVGWRMEGVSWLDDWQQAGFDAWALDFAGFGLSGRPKAFELDAMASPPFGRCQAAASQIGAALHAICRLRPHVLVHLVAHSWGTLPAQQAAIDHPNIVDRLVLFGPVVPRQEPPKETESPAWILINEAAQRPRQRTGLPNDQPTPVGESEIDRWCDAYLDSDPNARLRTPRSVKVPGGPGADIGASRMGVEIVSTRRIRQPTLIVRGEWDHVCTDADAGRLFDALTDTSDKRDLKISGGNHWLHLQPRRMALWEGVRSFLMAEDRSTGRLG